MIAVAYFGVHTNLVVITNRWILAVIAQTLHIAVPRIRGRGCVFSAITIIIAETAGIRRTILGNNCHFAGCGRLAIRRLRTAASDYRLADPIGGTILIRATGDTTDNLFVKNVLETITCFIVTIAGNLTAIVLILTGSAPSIRFCEVAVSLAYACGAGVAV
jgi:hypothetical protein